MHMKHVDFNNAMGMANLVHTHADRGKGMEKEGGGGGGGERGKHEGKKVMYRTVLKVREMKSMLKHREACLCTPVCSILQRYMLG